MTGATTQLAALYNAAQEVGPGQSLGSKVAQAQSKLASGDISGTCGMLGAFINQVETQSSKQIASASATQLIADAQGIQATLGC